MKTLHPSRSWQAAFISAARVWDESKVVRDKGRFAKKGTAPTPVAKKTPTPKNQKPTKPIPEKRKKQADYQIRPEDILLDEIKKPPASPERLQKRGLTVLEKTVKAFREYVIPNNPDTKNPILKPIAKVIGAGYRVLNGSDSLFPEMALQGRLKSAYLSVAVHGTASVVAAITTAAATATGSPVAAPAATWLAWEAMVTANQLDIMNRLRRVDDKMKQKAEKHLGKMKNNAKSILEMTRAEKRARTGTVQ